MIDNFEVEVKARIEDRNIEKIKEELDNRFGKGHPVDKLDIYYRFKNITENKPNCRIRIVDDELCITTKQNTSKDGVEANREIEFIHSKKDLEVIQSFFENLGLRVMRRKHKKGFEWTNGDMHIELLEVEPLGTFLETEIITDKNEEEDILPLKIKLFEFYKTLGITSFEERGYQNMLQAIGL